MKLLLLRALLVLALASGTAFANQRVTKGDLKALPPFCKGTQLIRDVSGDKTPLETYKKMYGKDFIHLHHYCWALNVENQYYKNPSRGKGRLQYAIGDLDYVIKHSSPTFVFIPEVHLAKARIYALLEQQGKAIAAAYQAIKLKPNYVQAYTLISDLYEKLGDKQNAIKALQSGFKHAPESKPILRRMARLGVTPPEPEIKPSQDPEPEIKPSQDDEGTDSFSPSVSEADSRTSATETLQNPAAAPQTTQELPKDSGATQPASQERPSAPQQPHNPYCRFCP